MDSEADASLLNILIYPLVKVVNNYKALLIKEVKRYIDSIECSKQKQTIKSSSKLIYINIKFIFSST